MRIWNITNLEGQPSTLSIYGRSVLPGSHVDVPDAEVSANRKPLEALRREGKVHLGARLPGNFQTELETKMLKITNKSGSVKDIKGAKKETGFGTLRIPPGGTAHLNDEKFPNTASVVKLDDDLEVEGLETPKPKDEKKEKELEAPAAPETPAAPEAPEASKAAAKKTTTKKTSSKKTTTKKKSSGGKKK